VAVQERGCRRGNPPVKLRQGHQPLQASDLNAGLAAVVVFARSLGVVVDELAQHFEIELRLAAFFQALFLVSLS
jgi:hypothetical protein